MKTEPLGDSAWILRELPLSPFAAARAIEEAQLPGLIEAVASYESVGLYVDPNLFRVGSLELVNWTHSEFQEIHHVVPVCYEIGEDLEQVAMRLGLSPDDVVREHMSVEYRCYAVGFCPGFPYLGYLPNSIAGTPRQARPRVRIQPGTVAITGRQTGIYPIERPGGWNLIGRTPLCIVDVESAYFPLKAGDWVRFESIGQADFKALVGNRL